MIKPQNNQIDWETILMLAVPLMILLIVILAVLIAGVLTYHVPTGCPAR